MVYSVPGSRSVRVVVVTSLGTVSCRRMSACFTCTCGIAFHTAASLALPLQARCTIRLRNRYIFFNSGLHLGSDAGWRCERDHVVVDGALDDAPHQSDGVICGGCHSQIHGHIQTCWKRGEKRAQGNNVVSLVAGFAFIRMCFSHSTRETLRGSLLSFNLVSCESLCSAVGFFFHSAENTWSQWWFHKANADHN